MTQSEKFGRMLAQRMATRKPMTKRDILKKWPKFGYLGNVDLAINWIEANTSTSDNPFLFVWDRGEAVWGFRNQFYPVAFNLLWNIRYLRTRIGTFQKVLGHAIDSPVVAMTMGEHRAAKAMLAQMGGVTAYIDTTVDALVKVTNNGKEE